MKHYVKKSYNFQKWNKKVYEQNHYMYNLDSNNEHWGIDQLIKKWESLIELETYENPLISLNSFTTVPKIG